MVYAIGVAVAQAMTVILYLLYARSSSPAEFGNEMALVTGSLFIAGFISFGSNIHLVREFASQRLRGADLLGRSLARSVVAVAVALGLASVGMLLLPGLSSCELFLAFVLIVASHAGQLATVPLLASGEHRVVAGLLIAQRTVSLVIAYLDIHFGGFAPGSILLALAAPAVVHVFATVGVVWLRRKPTIAVIRESRKYLFDNPWRGAGRVGLVSVLFGLQQLDINVVRAAGGAVAAGEYSVVARWVQPVNLLSNSLGQARFHLASKSESSREAANQFRMPILIGLGVSVGCLIVAATSHVVVRLLVGDAFAASAIVLSILMISSIPAYFSQLLYYFVLSRESERLLILPVALTVLFQFSVMAILTRLFGTAGAAVAILATQVAYLLVLLWVARRSLLGGSVADSG